jgi:hypothetical protein
MVNNHSKRAYFLRPFLLILFSLFFGKLLQAQKITKYYSSSIQGNGVLYFIEPDLEYKGQKDKATLFFDITYLSSKDTCTLNFSFTSKKLIEIDSLIFTQNNTRYAAKAEKIFIETDKELWKHRYTSQYTFGELDQLFQLSEKPQIFVYSDSNAIPLKVKTRKWKMQSEILSKIFTLIKVNKSNPR